MRARTLGPNTIPPPGTLGPMRTGPPEGRGEKTGEKGKFPGKTQTYLTQTTQTHLGSAPGHLRPQGEVTTQEQEHKNKHAKEGGGPPGRSLGSCS